MGHSFTVLLFLACAVFFYRAGDFEGAPGWLWATLSLAISAAVWFWLGGGFLAVLLAQLGLFAGITVYRMLKP